MLGASGRRRRQWHPTPVLLPGKSHGRRSLVGCSPWGRTELDTTERLHFHFSLSCIGEGNGNPLQCSCLENPRDGGAWWAAIYGVAQSQTRLKRLSSSSSSIGRRRRKQWQPTPVLLPGKSHGWRSLVGCSPWGHTELDTTERLHFHFSVSCIGEGNGKPLQCSCLENPRDGGAWWAAVYGVAQSWTRLKRLSSSSSGRRMGNYWLMDTEFKFCRMRVLEWMVLMDVQQYEYLIPLIYTLKMDKTVNFMLCIFCHNKN